jgi:hypothetical protein
MCDDSLLTPAEAKQAAAAENRRNFLACKSGEGYCDDSLMNPAQKTEVAETKRQRDLLACEANDVTCNASLNAQQGKHSATKPSS